MESKEVKRIRAGCIVSLKNIKNGNEVSYKIIHATKKPRMDLVYLYDDNPTRCYELAYELKEGEISDVSPLGKALLGKKVGDIALGYEIKAINATKSVVPNATDELEVVLEKQKPEVEKFLVKLRAGEWLHARVVSCTKLMRPTKEDWTELRISNVEIEGENFVSKIELTNEDIAITGLYRVILEVFNNFDDSFKATAKLIIEEERLEKFGIKSWYRSGQYSVYDPEDARMLRSCYVRYDENSESLYYKANPLGRTYYFDGVNSASA